MSYGDVLKRLLDEKGVTNAELARRIGKSRSYVSQLQNGKIAEPTFSMAIEISNALDTEIEYFVVRLDDEEDDEKE